MRKDPGIFFAHTLRRLLVEDVHVLFHFWSDSFWVYVKADFVTSTLICGLLNGDAMAARERRCEYVLRA
jgi:hypothetical protein